MRIMMPKKQQITLDIGTSTNEPVKDCHACPLRDNATQVVWGKGTDKTIVIIGEAPGSQEDIEGRPFIGDSGQLLKRAIGQNDFYITNTVKCRPPYNATPDKKEILKCSGLYIRDEIKDAKIVILLGRTAQSIKIFDPEGFKSKIVMEKPHPAHALYKHYEDEWVMSFKNDLRYLTLMFLDPETAYAINEKL